LIRANHIAVAILAGVGLAACSSGSLTTSSLFGGSPPPKAPTAVNDTSARTLQVATTSARAAKCGYNFDQQKLRSSFLAAEAAASPGTDMGKVQQAYDMTARRIAASIAKDEDFCSEDMTREIKADLSRHLSGDFTPRVKYEPAPVASATPSNPPMDRERIFDPTGIHTPKPSSD
jgi:hypothetical protein